MAIYQVSRVGSKFCVLEDGNPVSGSERDTRGEAIKHALELKEA